MRQEFSGNKTFDYNNTLDVEYDDISDQKTGTDKNAKNNFQDTTEKISALQKLTKFRTKISNYLKEDQKAYCWSHEAIRTIYTRTKEKYEAGDHCQRGLYSLEHLDLRSYIMKLEKVSISVQQNTLSIISDISKNILTRSASSIKNAVDHVIDHRTDLNIAVFNIQNNTYDKMNKLKKN